MQPCPELANPENKRKIHRHLQFSCGCQCPFSEELCLLLGTDRKDGLIRSEDEQLLFLSSLSLGFPVYDLNYWENIRQGVTHIC